jgi:hypothetical protein
VTLWAGVLLFVVLWVGLFVVGLLAVFSLIALDVNDPRAWLAARKYRRLQLPPATARQIKRSRRANRAELAAIEMPRLPRVPRARSDFDTFEGST